jgi:alanine racemase
MDMIAVDLGADAKDNIGDRVVLWGPELPVETVAQYADTIPYTLLCGVTTRVKFEWRGGRYG